MRTRFKKLFSFAGVIAPLYFFILVTVLGPLWKGYNFIKEYVSALGADGSPYIFEISIFGFCLLGLVLIGFALSLHALLKKSRLCTVATILLVIGSTALFSLGIFRDDRYGTVTFHAKIHRIDALAVFISIPLSVILYGLVFKNEGPAEKVLQFSSLVLGAVALLATVSIIINPSSYYAGTIERLGIYSILIWVFLVSVRLLLENKMIEIFKE